MYIKITLAWFLCMELLLFLYSELRIMQQIDFTLLAFVALIILIL